MVRSGLNEMSKGLAEMSLVLICGFLTLIGVVCRMYPAVAKAGWRALLMFRHLNVWSPQQSCLEPHLQVGVLSGS